MKKFMTKSEKIGAAASFALGMAAVIVQACGSGAGSGGAGSAAAAAASSTGSVTAGTSTVFNACIVGTPSAVTAAMNGLPVSSVTITNSPDTTQVCQIVFGQNVIDNESSRAFLGPNAGSNLNDVYNTGVMLYPYDQFAGFATGAYGSSNQNAITDTPNGADDLYGEFNGGYGYFPIYGQVQTVPYTGGGYLYVGVNQGVGSGGAMSFNLQVEIQRCIDANGGPHQCPTEFTPSL